MLFIQDTEGLLDKVVCGQKPKEGKGAKHAREGARHSGPGNSSAETLWWGQSGVCGASVRE